MPKIILLLLSVITFTNSIKAQDTIYRKGGNIQIVNIMSENIDNVIFINHDDTLKRKFVVAKSDIRKIAYLNGKIININKAETIIYNENPIDYEHGTISLNLYDFLKGVFTTSFEYTNSKGNIMLKFPFSTGLNSTSRYGLSQIYYNSNKIFNTGIELYYFPFGRSRKTFYYGLSYEIGKIKNYNINSLSQEYVTSTFYSFLLNGGFIIKLSPKFDLTPYLGFGFSNIRYVSNIPIYTNLASRLGVNISYNFSLQQNNK